MTLYLLLGAALFAMGLFALVTQPHLLRKLLALNVMGGATFLWLAAIAARGRPADPDPVPHAMVLTGIVVAVSATAFGLALVRHLHAATGRPTMIEGGVDDDDAGGEEP